MVKKLPTKEELKLNPTARHQCIICQRNAIDRKRIFFHDGIRANKDLNLGLNKKQLRNVKKIHSTNSVVGFNIPYCSDKCLKEILKRTEDYRF